MTVVSTVANCVLFDELEYGTLPIEVVGVASNAPGRWHINTGYPECPSQGLAQGVNAAMTER
jgi:hypothetical protein